MKLHSLDCIEFNGGNTYKVPPAADPNDNNLNLEVKVYKLNPDGSKGELIRTDPAYPEGWDVPKFNSNIKEESIMLPRKDRDEIVATAKKLMTEGKSMTKTVEILKLPLSTLATWLSKDEKQKNDKLKSNNNKPLNENDKLKNTGKVDEIKNDFTTEPKPENNLYVKIKEMAQQTVKMNYGQAVNQLTLGFIIEIYASDLPPVDKLGLIAKQIKVWEEL